MGSERYRAGVLRGIRQNVRLGGYDWPKAIEGLGRIVRCQPLTRCAFCGPRAHPKARATWVRYMTGGVEVSLCYRHALMAAEGWRPEGWKGAGA